MSHISSPEPEKKPEMKYINDCVHCGFCLPACPTYVLWGEEMDSPRGRIYMMRKVVEGEAPLDARFRTHMDNCLGCMACMTACPSGVEYNKLIEPTRALIERNIPRSAGERLFRKLIFSTFPHPARLRVLALPLLLYQKSGLQSLVRKSGLAQAASQAARSHGSIAARGAGRRIQAATDYGAAGWRDPPPRGHAERLRAARVLSAGERRHGARARRGRMRSDHSPRASRAAARSCSTPASTKRRPRWPAR